MYRRLKRRAREHLIDHASLPDVRIGIALGSGSSRGWSHIGILRALAEIGIAQEAIQEGRECVGRMLPEIRYLVKPG